MIFLFQSVIIFTVVSANSKLFREYIGAEFNHITFHDVPIHPNVEFHFILSFAVDYSDTALTTNGYFHPYWDTQNLTPSDVSSIKDQKPNVKVAVSLGGDSLGNGHVYFQPKSINSWVKNAITSLTQILNQYHLDGIDIDYEHFKNVDTNTFAECIGQLITSLKQKKLVSFVSIAPFNDDSIQPYYLALWKKYGHLIDYVNFQFYSYDKGTTVSQFIDYFDTQSSNYKGGKVLVSIGTDGSGGLSPKDGFFEACRRLRNLNKLNGIFIWSADDSKKAGFQYERQSQNMLATIQ